MSEIDADSLAFLSGDGTIGALMRETDWSASPLGHPACWPTSLRVVVNLMLGSKFPMFIAWGPELGFLYNDAYIDVLGEKHPSALGRRFHDIWFEIWDDIHPIIVQAMEGKATYHENLPLKMRRKGYDEQTWFTFSYSPVRDESGSIAGMYCACTETTKQILAERHRVGENERFRQLFEQAPGIIAVLRESSHIFEIANAAYRELTGNRPLIGKAVREALPELGEQGFYELLDTVYATGKPHQGRAVSVKLLRQDGEFEERFVDFIYQPIRDSYGNVTGIFVEGSDVTDAVRTTAALHESEQRLRQLANTIPQVAWMADANGWVHWFNDRWFEYTGITQEQIQENNWEQHIHPEDMLIVQDKWQAAIRSGQPYEVTARIRAANGEYRPFFIRAAPLRDASGKIAQWFGTDTDVTTMEAAKNELKLANRRKDEFLAMLSHELRNPLAPISAAADLLKLQSLEGESVHQTSDIISRQVRHMAELIDDLLDVSRVTRGQVVLEKETLNLNGILDESIEQVQSAIAVKHQNLAVHASQVPLFIDGDRKRITQIIANLLNNAVKYTPKHGSIVVRLAAGEEQVECSVEDDGIGMSQELIPYVFDLFTQAERSSDRSQGGLGLGLPLVKSLVELHGGTVFAESEGEGKGSKFTVRLPRLTHAASSPESGKSHGAADGSRESLRLMVVDDNADAAKILCLLLQAMGHEVVVEHSAHRALECARHQLPQMLFLDIGLPDMDGYALVRRLRAMPETERSVLVAVTGYGQPEDKARAKEAGFDHHLVKPVKLAAILDLLAGMEKASRI